jgi:hypothetical protein
VDLALAVDDHFVDPADPLVVGPINIKARELGATHHVGRHLGHQLARSA